MDNGGYVRIDGDFYVTIDVIKVPAKPVALDLNGHWIELDVLMLPKGTELTIQDNSQSKMGLLKVMASISLDGRLAVTGGSVHAEPMGASYPGIGGGCGRSPDTGCGTLVVTGGHVHAKGGKYAAGIGTGPQSGAPSVIITGGKVEAEGGYCAAGIGGGHGRRPGGIQITGGEVVAQGGEGGAGIGTGCDSLRSDRVPPIKISGGVVTATGGAAAAGIGGGRDSDGCDVWLTGGQVTTSGTVGIGGGTGRRFGTLVVGRPGGNPREVTVTLQSPVNLTDPNRTEVTVESGGQLTGPAPLTGTGRIANSGAITNDVSSSIEVSGNRHLVRFVGVDAPPVRVLADSFELAARPLPALPTGLAWYTSRTAPRPLTSTGSIVAAGVSEGASFTLYALARPAAPLVTVVEEAGTPVLHWNPVRGEGMSRYSFLLCQVGQASGCGPDSRNPAWMLVPGVDPVLQLGGRLSTGVSYQVWVRVLVLGYQGGGDLAGELGEPVTVVQHAAADLPEAGPAPGQVAATLGGVPMPVKVRARTGKLQASGHKWRVSVAGRSHGQPTVTTRGVPQGVNEQKVRITGNGFAADSYVQVWLLPDTPLGSLRSDAHGRLAGTLRLPHGREGNQTLQISGPATRTAAELVVNLGIQVNPALAVATSNGGRLRVQVLPRCATGYHFVIQAPADDNSGTWRKIGRTHRTTGTSQTHSVKLPPGTYRAVIRPHCGQPRTTTNLVNLGS